MDRVGSAREQIKFRRDVALDIGRDRSEVCTVVLEQFFAGPVQREALRV